jgi:hypothetical protein
MKLFCGNIYLWRVKRSEMHLPLWTSRCCMTDICHYSTAGQFASRNTRGISIVPVSEGVSESLEWSMVDFRQGQVFLFVINVGTDLASARLLSGARCNTTNQKVEGLFPDGMTGIFHWRNPSCRTMALGSIKSLQLKRTRNISSAVKAAGT